MLQPSVVERVSATCSGVTPSTAASLPRTSVSLVERPREVRLAAATLRDVDQLLGENRLDRSPRERPVRARVQVRHVLEHGKGGACVLEARQRPSLSRMRVLLADPPAFTPQYDHALASALAEAGADVELVTSPFRLGDAPEPDGYRRSELFYPVSSRVFRRSRLRIPVKLHRASRRAHAAAATHGRRRPSSSGWPRPSSTTGSSGSMQPLVFTAHDILPRRTAGQTRPLAAALRPLRAGRRPQRARSPTSSRSSTGGSPARHPAPRVSRANPPRADDGRTLLSLGIVRAYKGIEDAIEATKAIDGTRLLVAGDPLENVNRYRALAGDRAEWRLGYLSDEEIDRDARRDDDRALPLPARDRPERGAVTGARGQEFRSLPMTSGASPSLSTAFS